MLVKHNTRFKHPQETWDVKKCNLLVKRTIVDGLGTKHHLKGMLHAGELGHYYHGMTVNYNGGTIINGEWWPGEEWTLPKLPEGFEIVLVPTWGYRIVRTANNGEKNE
jgi:hypothetical protein